jgi:hypothetical protein
MSNYLKHKPGSIEEVVAKQGSYREDSGYQAMFKKELEKTGKGIGSMTPAEKKAFFNKIDSKYSAKDEGMNQNIIKKKVLKQWCLIRKMTKSRRRTKREHLL